MKYRFNLTYELDCPLAIAVAVYLDAEHYIFLHNKWSDRLEVLEVGERTIRYRQSWRFLGLRVGQTYTAEHVPPAQFKNYDIRPEPAWMPSVHHLCSIRTHLTYRATARDTTFSDLAVEIDMPFWLWPFRGLMRESMERIKREKDREDVDMIEVRAKRYGRENNDCYLRPEQFMLFKDDYVAHFGPGSVPLTDAARAVDDGDAADVLRSTASEASSR